MILRSCSESYSNKYILIVQYIQSASVKKTLHENNVCYMESEDNEWAPESNKC